MKSAVIATTTFYFNLDEVRTRLALKTICEARKLDYQIIVVDGSPNFIKDAFLNAGAIVLNQNEKGMGPGRRQAIREAANLAGPNGAVIWMEPEKTPLICQLNELLEYFWLKKDPLLIPGRRTLDSYPKSQQHAEWLGNRIFQMITGKDLDVWFGPRIFSTEISGFFLNYKGEYGDKWDSIFIPILRILASGKTVAGYGIDYAHPQEQTTTEENDLLMDLKRIEQLTTLVNAIRKESEILGLIREA